jgi:hypothetical protein
LSSLALLESVISFAIPVDKRLEISQVSSKIQSLQVTMARQQVPTRVLAGVVIPDTPIVQASIKFTEERLAPFAFNHVMRSFLFGFCISSKTPAHSDRDIEVHAVSAILHDLGWDKTGQLISNDKRFEVDGANAAREFLEKEASGWDKHRVQLVWDAIALHTTQSICLYKEVEVAACSRGISADFTGPDRTEDGKLTWEEYDAIVKEYPRLDFVDGVMEIFCGFCRTKPATTYDNLIASVGEKYVEGYSRAGQE